MQYWGLDKLGGSRVVDADFFKVDDGNAYFYRLTTSATEDSPPNYSLVGYIADPVVIQEVVVVVPDAVQAHPRLIQGHVE